MTPADSSDVAAFVNAGSARTSERVEFWLSVGLVMAVGLVAGLLICLWGQGCEPGHLCSVGAMLATAADRSGPWALRGRLTGIALDRLQAEREAAAMPLSDLLLATGAMTGPYRRPKPLFRAPSRLPTLTRPRAQLAEFIETYALYRRGGNTRRYSARIAYGCAFLGLPF